MVKKVLFFTTPAYGHIIPVAPIIKELIHSHGYEISCYSSSQFEKEIISWGAKFIEYPFDTSIVASQASKISHFELAYQIIKEGHNNFKNMLNESKKGEYDIIFYDSLCLPAKHIAFKLGLKSVCFVTTLAVNHFVMLFSGLFVLQIKSMIKNRKVLSKIKKMEKEFIKHNDLQKFKMENLMLNKGTKTLILMPKEVQPFASTFSTDVEFVGTTIKERIKANAFDEYNTDNENYDYYVSLGTVVHGNQELVENIASELSDKGKTLVSTGNENLTFHMSNVVSKTRVNQIKILPNIKYFVNHGGFNSVMESIYFNVPQICFPQTEEQTGTSLWVKKMKLGLCFKKYKRGNLKDIQYNHVRLEYFSKILRETDGTKNAVNIILSM